uniref:Uncharacterized protein n=1 Tax=Panagrolaimus sp. JU765 TaxID=591449 RepID=A0AC34PX55_9BILA
MESENEYKVPAMPEEFINFFDKIRNVFELCEEFKNSLIPIYVKKEEDAPFLLFRHTQTRYLKNLQVEFKTIIDNIQELLGEETAEPETAADAEIAINQPSDSSTAIEVWYRFELMYL